jgi:hypothetical protein
LLPGKDGDPFGRGLARGNGPYHRTLELAYSIVCRLAGMEEDADFTLAERILDLGKTGDDLPRLVGERERFERHPFEQALDQLG